MIAGRVFDPSTYAFIADVVSVIDASSINFDKEFDAIDASIVNLDSSISELDSSIIYLYENPFDPSGYATIEYVDGSLSIRDSSISHNLTLINNLDSSVNWLFENPFDPSGYATESYVDNKITIVDNSISNLDSSVDYLFENPATGDVTKAYVDASLLIRDNSISYNSTELNNKVPWILGTGYNKSNFEKPWYLNFDASEYTNINFTGNAGPYGSYLRLGGVNPLILLERGKYGDANFKQRFILLDRDDYVDDKINTVDASIINLNSSINTIDSSVEYLFENPATGDVTKAYVDASLLIRDNSISDLDSSVNYLYENPVAGESNLRDLKDVSLNDVSEGDMIVLDADLSTWVNVPSVDLSTLEWSDSNIKTYVDGSLAIRDTSISYNLTNINNLDSSVDYLYENPVAGESNLRDLKDVSLNGVSEGDMIVLDADLSTWVNVPSVDLSTVDWLDSSIIQYVDASLLIRDNSISNLDSSVDYLFENPTDLTNYLNKAITTEQTIQSPLNFIRSLYFPGQTYMKDYNGDGTFTRNYIHFYPHDASLPSQTYIRTYNGAALVNTAFVTKDGWTFYQTPNINGDDIATKSVTDNLFNTKLGKTGVELDASNYLTGGAFQTGSIKPATRGSSSPNIYPISHYGQEWNFQRSEGQGSFTLYKPKKDNTGLWYQEYDSNNLGQGFEKIITDKDIDKKVEFGKFATSETGKWFSIVTSNDNRVSCKLYLYDYHSGGHGSAEFFIDFSFGVATITQLNANRYNANGVVVDEIRVVIDNSDAIYGNPKIQIKPQNPYTAYYAIEYLNNNEYYNGWELVDDPSTDTATTYREIAKISDIHTYTTQTEDLKAVTIKVDNLDASDIDVSGNIKTNGYVYIGTKWRFYQDSNDNLIYQYYNGSTWVTKQTINH